jgi:hypothetical protein
MNNACLDFVHSPAHPSYSRRQLLQAGGLGLLGLSLGNVSALRAAAEPSAVSAKPPKSVIYIFLTGGLAQHESFDMKPEAPADVRGEFEPIATKTPGLFICEHLPRLAARSDKWGLCRSVSHSWSEHIQATCLMLTGRSELPPGFTNKSKPTDFPGMAAIGGRMISGRSFLPGSAVLPYSLETPGTAAGQMGSKHDPWLLTSAPKSQWSGAQPNSFDHQRRPIYRTEATYFETPSLELADGVNQLRFDARQQLLQMVEAQQRSIERTASMATQEKYRSGALKMLTSGDVRSAFDVEQNAPEVLDAYGRNTFGYSLLLAARLVEVGVGMVQVNLGRGGFDTHGNAFDHLRNLLLPPLDQSVAALLDDLEARGLLDDTLVVMASEFGRTPKITRLPQFYELPGRDHWGPVQSVFFAGGGVPGGTVIGASDKIGGFPIRDLQTPESVAATIYDALGIDRHAAWQDDFGRPFHVYQADPIPVIG